jgi:hypothetical protein
MQNLVALLLVSSCVGYVGWQLVRTISFGNGKAGKCCSKGCDAVAKAEEEKPKSGVQFIASDSLRRKR